MGEELTWGHSALSIEFHWTPDSPVRMTRLVGSEGLDISFTDDVPLVEILTVGNGHSQASDRLIDTKLGASLRYDSHQVREQDGWSQLELRLGDADAGVYVTLLLSSPVGVPVVRASVRVSNTSASKSLRLLSVTTWASGFGYSTGSQRPDFGTWNLVSGLSDWLGEGRWETEPLRGANFPSLAQELTGHNPRGCHAVVSKGTWSTGKNLPVAAVESEAQGAAWLWQIEHNGGWRWEVGENTGDGYFALSGPTDLDHQWSEVLQPGDTFETVPAAFAVAHDIAEGISALTAYRRKLRRPHVDNETLPVVFNDYMNTLNGDPTTDRLLPLIDSAAEVGAEVFCIDAGWYDNGGSWWDTVGEWEPSTTRFPGGLGEVIDHIRNKGMVPGLWLEPEVVGVRSPMAQRLPAEAFLSRDGERVVEHDRYHLDLRHPAAREHLDGVVDRLVSDFGVGFFKLDYNINPGPGTDIDGDSIGAGLLAHNRAHLEWLDSVLDRHPHLVLENCGSGAMRMDYAMLSRLQVQSTSDQQDYLKYPPIAAAAPMSMLPEQAASWAYPQPNMGDEEAAFCLVTGMLGRFYLSGYLNQMTPGQKALVSEAVAANKALRSDLVRSVPFWPLGLPDWTSPWVSLGLKAGSARYITVWNRSGRAGPLALVLPDFAGRDVTIRTVFPVSLPQWQTAWDKTSGTLQLLKPTTTVGARTFEIMAK